MRTHYPSVRPTRRASARSYAQCGYDNIKKVLLDFFQKIAGSSGQRPWSLHRNGAKSLIPKTSSARGSKMPAGILRRGRIARASPMDEVGSMPTSSIKTSEPQTTGYALAGTTWAGTALTGFRPLSPTDCPVDSRVAAQCLCSLFADIYSPK